MDNECRVIVVRARRDGRRLIIRILANGERVTSARQWVFADVTEACVQVDKVLRELDGEAQPNPARDEARLQQMLRNTRD
jgi:hypothetical protein